MNAHFDEIALQDYLDDPEAFPLRDALEAHVAGCFACRARLDQVRSFNATLASGMLWNLAASAAGDPPDATRALAEQLAREDVEAEALLAPLAGSPAIFRRAGIAGMPGMRTAGVVRRLCARSRPLRETQPMHALALADAAVALARQLPRDAYPQALLDELRGDAWYERGNSLRALERYGEALDALDIADSAYSASPIAIYWTAVVDASRAEVFADLGRLDEALRLTRKSARIFRQFGEDERYVRARILEGNVLYERTQYRDARDQFLGLITITRNYGDGTMLAQLYVRVADCQLELNELASAGAYYARAVSLFEALGLESERLRARWKIGCLRIAAGEVAEGLTLLRESRAEFDRIGARTDAALVALDLAEALLAGETAAGFAEAADLCSAVSRSLADVAMTGPMTAALALLHDAIASGTVNARAVRHVRDSLAARPDDAATPFVPPQPREL